MPLSAEEPSSSGAWVTVQLPAIVLPELTVQGLIVGPV
jgi:hypothetical protein